MKVLGVVAWTATDKGGHPIAGVVPLFEIQKADWRRISPTEEFPTQGQAFWPAAQGATERLLVYFRTEPNPGQKDEFKAIDPKPAPEVLDLRAVGGPTEVRATLVAGLDWHGAAPSRALLWCKPNLLVGPVELALASKRLLKIAGSSFPKVPTFTGAEPRSIHDGSQERLVRVDESAPSGYVDWDDDATVLRRALQAAVRLAKEAGRDTSQSKKQIEEAAAALTAQGAGPDSQLELSRLERARGLCANTALLAKVASEVVDALRSHPEISAALTRLEAETRAEAVRAARAGIEQTLAGEHQAVRELITVRDRTRDEATQEAKRLDGLRGEVKAFADESTKTIREIEDEMGRRVRSIMERPSELLAEVSVIRPLLASTFHVAAKDQTPVPLTAQKPLLEWSRARGDTVSDRVALRRVLTAAARARGLAPASMVRLHATIAAGLIPVVMGSRALAGLAAYAHAICGRRLGVLSVSPGFVRPDDLLGSNWAGQFEPHPTGLLSASTAAAQAEGVSLLVLEGANRAPLECCLLPLLQLRDGGLPLISPQSAETWEMPPGLRLAVTLVVGATTVPVTPELWFHAAALDPEPDSVLASPAGPGDAALASDLFALGDVPTEAVEGLLDAWPEASEVRAVLGRLGAALTRFSSDIPDIQRALLEGVVVPLVVTTLPELDQEEVLRKLDSAEDSGLTLWARRLRRRLR